MNEYNYVWWWKTKLPDRRGQSCRILIEAPAMNTILVEFEDGYKVVTGKHAVRPKIDTGQEKLFE
jgi:hypothetical protein